MQLKNHIILGLYSDPSALSLELAVVETDGLDIKKVHHTSISPYPHELIEQLHTYLTAKKWNKKLFNQLGREVTQFFIQEAESLLAQMHAQGIQVDFIGLSGHPALHDPEQKLHQTFGNAEQIANALHKPVVHHFVKEDINAGGVGSPLLATFWATLCQHMQKPLAIVGLGGVTHLVALGSVGEIIGFDVGAGLSLLDNWIFKRTGEELDFNGTLSAKGKVDARVLKKLLSFPYLAKQPPKSVRRADFASMLEHVAGLSTEDGAATLTAFTAQSIVQAQQFLPTPPQQWIFIGGGTNNATLMLQLAQALPNVTTAQKALPYTQALNAMGFAFITARYLMGLPISLPSTTGVKEPFAGGELTQPAE